MKFSFTTVFISIFFSIFISSCSKNYLFNRDRIKISKDLNYIKLTDQLVRKYEGGIESKYKLITFNTLVDSANIFDPENIKNIDFSKIKPIKEQLDKLKPSAKSNYLDEIKQANLALHIIDSINRNNLFKIIKKYGYPSYDLRDWGADENRNGVTYVLTHTYPNSTFGIKLQKLMIKEFYKGRVEEGEMRHYLWHVDGRIGEIDRTTPLLEWVKKIENKLSKS